MIGISVVIASVEVESMQLLTAPARLLAEPLGQWAAVHARAPPLVPPPGELHDAVFDSAYWSQSMKIRRHS